MGDDARKQQALAAYRQKLMEHRTAETKVKASKLMNEVIWRVYDMENI